MPCSTETIERPRTDTRTRVGYDRGWNVLLWNDDFHTFDEVILQVQKATGCKLAEAIEITWTAHSEGKAVCFSGMLERCEMVAAVLREIKLRVTIERAE